MPALFSTQGSFRRPPENNGSYIGINFGVWSLFGAGLRQQKTVKSVEDFEGSHLTIFTRVEMDDINSDTFSLTSLDFFFWKLEARLVETG